MRKIFSIGILLCLMAMVFAGCGKKIEETTMTEATTENEDNATTEIITTENEDNATTEDATEDNSTSQDSNSQNGDRVVDVLAKEFDKQATIDGTDTTKIADNLSKNPIFNEVAMGTMEMQEGYLEGFNEDIKGFSKCTRFSPIIGTIPFVGYVFETDDTAGLVKTLEENAKLNWNICTCADDMISAVNGKYVLFIMAPNNFDN